MNHNELPSSEQPELPTQSDAAPTSEKLWRPISARARRVLGVLFEKAKTTPNSYPLTLNALTNGCNQKSNRYPVMHLEPADVEDAVEELREAGAATLIQGAGWTEKFRHNAYDWLSVGKVESAVMTELLLRGAQTIGELRGRAARMEAIADLNELRPILDGLKARGLVVSLTPTGRGHVVTHGLYLDREWDKVRAPYEGQTLDAPPPVATAAVSRLEPLAPPAIEPGLIAAMERQFDEMKSQIGELRQTVEETQAGMAETQEELRRLKDDLGV
jgi:uncharacterized protein